MRTSRINGKRSHDKLCHVAMLVEYTDEFGNEHVWNSWEDALCGCYEAMKLLPASSTNVRVRFQQHVGPAVRPVRAVERAHGHAWRDGQEEVCPCISNLDCSFETRGPPGRCYVWRAWNM